jgi:hypothetical protein
MERQTYAVLDSIRREFRNLVEEWSADNLYLREAQERVRKDRGYEDYRVETSIVYNRALDDIRPIDEVKIVLVADNPGKNEQLAENNRYLVGQSGKLAEGWFRRELGIDFRREVLILNKTPVHTPKTAELALLARNAKKNSKRLESLLAESQKAMVDLAWRLYCTLREAPTAASSGAWPVLWISGVGELRRGGLFAVYRDGLAGRLSAAPRDLLSGVWAFNHFSMNQFAIELKRKARTNAPMDEELARIGQENRIRVFGL